MSITPRPSGGEEALRAYIQANWTYLGLVDDTGTTRVRIEIGNDTVRSGTGREAVWAVGSGSNPLEATVTIKGGDSDIPTPLALERTRLYAGQNTSAVLSEDTIEYGGQTSVANIEAPGDKVEITHKEYQPRP